MRSAPHALNRRSVVFLLLPLVYACDSSTGLESPMPPQYDTNAGLGAYVTPTLASNITTIGVFRTAEPSWALQPMLTVSEAGELARVFARDFGPHYRRELERQRGGTIDFDRLTVSSNPIVANSAYESLPSNTFAPFAKAAGPYYIFILEHQGVPVLSVSVSALATDVYIAGGKLVFPKAHGNEFRLSGIPAVRPTALPIRPETAVQIAARAAGAKVRSMPTFIRRGFDWSPDIGYWRIELDRSSRFTTASGETISTSVVYVNYDGKITSQHEASAFAASATVKMPESAGGHDVTLIPRRQ